MQINQMIFIIDTFFSIFHKIIYESLALIIYAILLFDSFINPKKQLNL